MVCYIAYRLMNKQPMTLRSKKYRTSAQLILLCIFCNQLPLSPLVNCF